MPSLIQQTLQSTLRFLLNRVVGKLIAVPIRRRLAQFEAATARPREVQEALLRGILQYHKDTAFGRDHGFATIRTVADFRRQLPVAGYEAIEPYVARMRRGETRALVADPVVHMFALTSGSTAVRKFIPVTPHYLDDYKRGWNLWGLKAYRDHPAIKFRPILQMAGDPEEFRTEAGTPCGAVTGLTALAQKRIIRWLYCVPGCVARIKDPAAKYYAALRLSAARPVHMIIAANPSTMINLARALDREKESLIRDIRDGTLSERFDMPADVRQALAKKVRRKNPERARELEAVAAKTGTLYPRDVWPADCLLGNWTGGSVGAYLRHYPRYYGAQPIRDVGLIASEGRMTIPFADGTPAGILDVTANYFEFIPEGELDSPRPTVLGAHEVQAGRTYYIVPTTKAGLYRYHIHDLVRVTGFYNRTPLVEFLSKGSLFANLTGEKLSEYHVTGAMLHVLRELDLTLTAYGVAPCWPADGAGEFEQPYYGLFVERGDLTHPAQAADLARKLDARLCADNVEYADKRASGRLGAVRVEPVRAGFWAAWDRERQLRTGGPAEQYKHPCLIADLKFHEAVKSQQGLVA